MFLNPASKVINPPVTGLNVEISIAISFSVPIKTGNSYFLPFTSKIALFDIAYVDILMLLNYLLLILTNLIYFIGN